MSSSAKKDAGFSVEPAGTVILITGLSGAGKSVIARKTYELLRKEAPNTVLLDGDIFRSLMGNDLGYSREDRLKNAYRIFRFCKLLSDQNIHVVCSTMSLFNECHEWNRKNLKRYFEVYIRVSMEVLMRRDSKGLYSRAQSGGEQGIVGVDLPFQEPVNPDLVIDNNQERSDFTDLASRILRQSRCPE